MPVCSFSPAGVNNAGRCVPCGSGGRPVCLSAPLHLLSHLHFATAPVATLCFKWLASAHSLNMIGAVHSSTLASDVLARPRSIRPKSFQVKFHL